MADGQGQAPQMESGAPSPRDGQTATAGGQGQGGGDAAYWCYQCNKEVVAEPDQDGGPGSMVCTECHSGFIEALVTAQTMPDVRRAQRRRRRRGTATAAAVVAGTAGGAGATRQMVPLSQALEHLYPQQLMQVLQLLGQASNRSNNPAPATQDQESEGTVQAQTAAENQPAASQDAPPAVSQGDVPLSAETLEGQIDGRDTTRVERPFGTPDVPEGADPTASPNPFATADALERLAQAGHMMFMTDASPGHEEDADEELGVSDSESEEGMRLEFDAWDSADEDDEEEWEEVDEEEEVAGAGAEEGAVGEENEAEQQDGEQTEEQPGEERGGNREREIGHRVREFRLRTRNMEYNLHQYLQELLQNLVGQNIEVRVELPHGPLYVGNPGDYVDARGFEQLLQQMAENDNSRRGAPPAAKTVRECLPSISIEKRHLDDGSAVCAICKDVVALGEPAKQLPCLHLYHNDCILPWLSSRNSCPVCRYELPTDDPDYEEQKQNRNATVPNTNSQSPGAETETAEGQEGSNVGGNEAQNGSGQHQNSRESNFEAVELGGTSSSEDGVEQEQHGNSADCSFLQGPESVNTNLEQPSSEAGEIARGENERHEVDRGETLRGTGRGWFLLAAGPVLSMMGLVLVLCIGNHLIGGRIQHLGQPLQTQQHHFFQEPHIEQIGVASEVQGRRRWWMPFQR